MRTLPTLLLSLSLAAIAWTIGRVADRVTDRGIKITFLHIIATPQEIKKP